MSWRPNNVPWSGDPLYIYDWKMFNKLSLQSFKHRFSTHPMLTINHGASSQWWRPIHFVDSIPFIFRLNSWRYLSTRTVCRVPEKSWHDISSTKKLGSEHTEWNANIYLFILRPAAKPSLKSQLLAVALYVNAAERKQFTAIRSSDSPVNIWNQQFSRHSANRCPNIGRRKTFRSHMLKF